jgi:hypothetical protein
VLIRLETGDWVDPAEVRGVLVGQDAVVLLLRGGNMASLDDMQNCDVFGVADTVARQINAALAPSGRLGPAGPDLPIGAVSTKGA